MAFVHGKGAVFWLDDSGGTLRDLSAYITNVSFRPVAAADETTTMSKNSKTFIAGLKDATISISGFFDSSSNASDVVFWNALGATSTKTFEYGPEGGTSGKIKYTGECIGTSYSPGDADVNGVVPFSAELQVTGDVSRSTFS